MFTNQSTPPRLITAIIFAALVVGTLDIAAALLLTWSRGGHTITLLQYIAAGVFGKDAFAGGWLYAMFGLLFHYGIALIWTIVFFLIAGTKKYFQRNRVIVGILYGLTVWGVMNLVVVPLSNTPASEFKWSSALIGAGVLIIAIGLPLAFLQARYARAVRTRHVNNDGRSEMVA